MTAMYLEDGTKLVIGGIISVIMKMLKKIYKNVLIYC